MNTIESILWCCCEKIEAHMKKIESQFAWAVKFVRSQHKASHMNVSMRQQDLFIWNCVVKDNKIALYWW